MEKSRFLFSLFRRRSRFSSCAVVDSPHNPEVTSREVLDTIFRRPRWETTILSDFPESTLLHPTCLRLVLRRLSSAHPLLSLRYLLFLSSRFPASSSADPATSSLLLSSLSRFRFWKPALLLLRSNPPLCRPSLPDLDSFFLHLFRDDRDVLEEALDAVSHLHVHSNFSPSLPAWNCALHLSVRSGRADLVWRAYEIMMNSGVAGDASTAGYLIRAFCKEGKLQEAYRLLRASVRNGILPDVVAITALISGFSCNGNYDEVSELLHLMIAGGRMPNVFTYQAVIHGLFEKGMGEEGLRIFNEIKIRGYAPGIVTYTTVIDGLCKMRRMTDVWKLWQEMIGKGIEPDEYTYNAIVDGYCKSGYMQRARKMYKEMCDKGFKESIVSCNKMIAGFCLEGMIRDAVKVFEEMPAKGIKRDVVTYNTLIQGFCKVRKIKEAMKLYHELLSVGLDPRVSTYTPLIQAMCREGNVVEAMELKRLMEAKGLEPLVCTNDYIIIGFCKLGKTEEGIAWLVNMLGNNLKPKWKTVHLLVESLCSYGRVDDALLVLNAMSEIGYLVGRSACSMLVKKLCKRDHRCAELQLLEQILYSVWIERIERKIEKVKKRNWVDDALPVVNPMFEIGYLLGMSACSMLVNKLCEGNHRHAEILEQILVRKQLHCPAYCNSYQD